MTILSKFGDAIPNLGNASNIYVLYLCIDDYLKKYPPLDISSAPLMLLGFNSSNSLDRLNISQELKQ